MLLCSVSSFAQTCVTERTFLNLALYFIEIQLQERGSHWEGLLWNLEK